MYENKRIEQNSEMEIDIRRLIDAIWQKKWLIALVSAVCAAAVFLVTYFFVTPKYQSEAMFYVNNNDVMGGSSGTITSSDITASKDLVESYIVILNTRASLTEIIEQSGVDLSCESLQKMLDASAVNSTEIFRVVVTSTDPEEAEQIAKAISIILPKRISSILEGTSANVVDEPVVPTEPSSPSYLMNTLVGFVLGFVMCLAVVVLRELFDVTIRSEEEIAQICELPILTAVPDMNAPAKGGYYYSDSQKRKGLKKSIDPDKFAGQVGANLSFAASEAYKLLRTKVQFSFADESDCHVIGISSAMAGEGKSTSAANLAYTLAQLNHRVLLIDGDLRRPTIHSKLSIKSMPGLTDYLTRQVQISEVIQTCTLDEVSFNVISAGQVPPNPIELLSSERMEKTMAKLREAYDYVIVDLPPVHEVSDALVMAKMADGILMVVRQDYSNRSVLAKSIRQFEFVDARIMGVMVTCASGSKAGYSKKYYYHYKGGYAPDAK